MKARTLKRQHQSGGHEGIKQHLKTEKLLMVSGANEGFNVSQLVKKHKGKTGFSVSAHPV